MQVNSSISFEPKDFHLFESLKSKFEVVDQSVGDPSYNAETLIRLRERLRNLCDQADHCVNVVDDSITLLKEKTSG